MAATARRVAVKGYLLGEDVEPIGGVSALCAELGIGETGAVLVRPDGFVGWRSAPRERPSPTQLGRALDQILGRG